MDYETNGRAVQVLSVNPAAFFTVAGTDWDDIQFLDNQLFGTSLVVLTRNAGDARIRGLEIETEFAATNNLSLRGAFAYLDAEYTRVADGFFGQPIVPIDQALSRTPEFKASVGGTLHRAHRDGRRDFLQCRLQLG